MKTMSTTKKLMIGTMFAAALVVGAGSTTGSAAQAQICRRPHVIVVPRTRVFTYPVYPVYPRPVFQDSYSYSYTPRYDAGPYGVAAEKGYHDGFDRGREDARDGRRFDPNNSSHFRDSISNGYRDGFRRGYADGYRQVAR